MSKRRKSSTRHRGGGGFDEDEDAYLVPSDWEDDDDDEDWNAGGTSGRRARDLQKNLTASRGAKGAAASSSGKGKAASKQQQKQQHRAGAANTDDDDDDDEDGDDSMLMNLKDCRDMQLKPQHTDRPIWVLPDGHIYLEASSPYYHQAYDFLVAIAEPVSRPEFVHEYKLTPYSLYAAVAVSIDTDSIIKVLNRLSKTPVPDSVETFIRACTVSYGKAKLVLKHNKHYIESPFPEVLRELLKNPTVSQARLGEEEEEEVAPPPKTAGTNKTAAAGGAAASGAGSAAAAAAAAPAAGGARGGGGGAKGGAAGDGFTLTDAPQEMDVNLEYKELAREGDGDDADPDVMMGTQPGGALKNVAFRVKNSEVEHVKKAANDMEYPLMEEYDFRNDTLNPPLKIDLKANTRIRAYQEKSLSKMFGNGRARSGIIVLPCGAGKTLTGVTAASTIKKSCLVLCTSGVSVLQWKYQFQLWTDIAEKDISCFTSDIKEAINEEAGVLITTYSMISFAGQRSEIAKKIIDTITKREWGFMLLDEVHVVPARMFRKVLSVCNAHCKLGLTATLVREDDLISDLNFLIGPKLYEANWMDLTQSGYLANVQCVEAWCPMTAEFYSEYLKPGVTARQKQLLYIMNPNKTCEYLVRTHMERNDKVIIFGDNVFSLKKFATILQIPFIYGATPESERSRILGTFRVNPLVNCIGLSKVGDTSIDIPEANVIIQISSHFGSRRQEAQRLGRILRPKSNVDGGFNAFFYTLVSTDTSEMYYSSKRQQYLVDQGYTFKVVTDLANASDRSQSKLPDRKSELRVLQETLMAKTDQEEKDEKKMLDRDMDDIGEGSARGTVMRRKGNLGALSGADGSRYMEYDSRPPPKKHPLFKSRYVKM
ncbi:unnamed protein product [Ectocarpus sp. CCAP 1310/34]|nr:unnamed protein product [Ectocarpus sp. CCAP 1310/34]